MTSISIPVSKSSRVVFLIISIRRKILKINVVLLVELNPISFTPRFHLESKALLYYPIIILSDAIWSTMSMTRYATLCQQCRIFVVRVPLLFGACRRVRIKGRGGHVLAVPSHASRGACCHCRYPQSRNDHAHAGHSIDPLRVSNRVSKTPKESSQPPSSRFSLLIHFFFALVVFATFLKTRFI